MVVGEREIVYLSLHCYHQNDSCIKTRSDESHFNVSVGSDGRKVTRQCPQTTAFLERKESRSRFEPKSCTYQRNALPLGQTGSQPQPDHGPVDIGPWPDRQRDKRPSAASTLPIPKDDKCIYNLCHHIPKLQALVYGIRICFWLSCFVMLFCSPVKTTQQNSRSTKGR